MQPLQRQVLVLNVSYEPVQTCSVQKAMILVCKGAAIVQEPSGHFLRSQKAKFPLPSVIRLLSYRNVPRAARSVSRKNILLRDGYRCQYCNTELAASKLTLDHVHPKSKGGRSSWENLVACCKPCNNSKGQKTLAEAGLQLLKKPGRFGIHQRHRQVADPSWGKYLFV